MGPRFSHSRIFAGGIAPPACVTYLSDGSPTESMFDRCSRSANVDGTPAKPVTFCSRIAWSTTLGKAKRLSMTTEAPTARWVWSRDSP